jgi:hypothetical protein
VEIREDYILLLKNNCNAIDFYEGENGNFQPE